MASSPPSDAASTPTADASASLAATWPLLVLSVLALAALYAPQPLLPQWAARYGRPESQMALVISVALLPLAATPLAAGALLRRMPTVYVLRGASVLLACSVAATAWAPPFAGLLALRVVQGTAIAALLTALMTHIVQTQHGPARQKGMAAYVAATILGGFLGRFGSGLAASLAPNGVFFLGLAALLLATDAGLRRLPVLSPPDASRDRTPLRQLLRHGPVMRICAFVFGLFFVFSAVMNFLPFRLHAIRPSASEGLVGAAYAGYLVGIVSSLGARRMVDALQHPRWVMGTGGGVVLASLAIAYGASVGWLVGAVAVLCAGFFVAHAIAANRVSAVAPASGEGAGGGLVNGLYVSVYYTGGVLGAYLPGFVYEAYGWTAFLLLLALVTGGGTAALFVCRR